MFGEVYRRGNGAARDADDDICGAATDGLDARGGVFLLHRRKEEIRP